MLGVFYAASAHRTGPLRMQVNRSPAMETANAPVLDDEHCWGSFVNGAARPPQLAPLNSARALAPPGSARAARLASASQLASSTVSGRAGAVRPLTSFAPGSGHTLAPLGSAHAARLASTDATDAVGVVRPTTEPTPAPAQPTAPSITVSGFGMSLSGYGMVQPLGGNALPENDARDFVDGVVQPLGGSTWIAAPTDSEEQTWSSFVNGGSPDPSHQPRAPRDPRARLAPPGSARAARLAAEAEREAEASTESVMAEAAAVEAAAAAAEAEAEAQAQAVAVAEAEAEAEAQAQAVAQAEAQAQAQAVAEAVAEAQAQASAVVAAVAAAERERAASEQTAEALTRRMPPTAELVIAKNRLTNAGCLLCGQRSPHGPAAHAD